MIFGYNVKSHLWIVLKCYIFVKRYHSTIFKIMFVVHKIMCAWKKLQKSTLYKVHHLWPGLQPVLWHERDAGKARLMSCTFSSTNLWPWQSHWTLRGDSLHLQLYSGWHSSHWTLPGLTRLALSHPRQIARNSHTSRDEKKKWAASKAIPPPVRTVIYVEDCQPQNYKESRIKKTLKSRFLLAREAGRLCSTTVCWPTAGYTYNF